MYIENKILVKLERDVLNTGQFRWCSLQIIVQLRWSVCPACRIKRRKIDIWIIDQKFVQLYLDPGLNIPVFKGTDKPTFPHWWNAFVSSYQIQTSSIAPDHWLFSSESVLKIWSFSSWDINYQVNDPLFSIPWQVYHWLFLHNLYGTCHSNARTLDVRTI